MVRKKSLLERMKANPRADWTIANVKTLCRNVGLKLTPPTSGSHYKVHSEFLNGMLTIPGRRPIKPFYIRDLVGLAEAHKQHIEAMRSE